MPSLSSMLLASALVCFTVASPVIDRRHSECPASTTFYKCRSRAGIQFEGCCSQDACTLGFCPDTQYPPSATVTPSTPSATPAQTSIPSSTPTALPATECIPGANFTQWEPKMYNVYPNATESKYTNLTDTFLITQETGAANKRDAIVVFSNINATDNAECELQWYQPLAGSNFGYFNSGMMTWYQLDIPEEKSFDEFIGNIDELSYDTVRDVIGDRVGQPDISFWPQSPSLMDHLVTTLPCKKELAFYATVAGDTEGIVIMESTPFTENIGPLGWNLKYTC
ncbi:hypothetical protein BU24DRAFT_419420 [Aaosphaeria arxii CBS 175.79]|uniref:Ubiquitin 3 binding protein But2 C-terminal domain-containing protein n=1 Tax=Aaosphaeria arxii CBS 175.79 TaxID=1450172 RepID=A0A6A5Y3F0_9PLEO|nr:uncharacterized protein BU24DRAFT_419420 [Aaosphaeria arxii CBS 175.79]KAF2019809.1 hypothetical protein BU24DRAFT_419420 [Aaosphaeria arxii CBS 175.79]